METRLPDRTDVLVIGAGVVGLSVAWALRRQGRSVLVLDRGRAGGGASHGNCGTITPSHALPLAQPGVVAKALRWMLRRDAPFYVKPRFDPALWAWLLRFASRCNEPAVRTVGLAKTRLLLDSRARLGDLIRTEGLDCSFSERGQIAVFRDMRQFQAQQAVVHLLREWGIPVEALSGDAVRRRCPGLKPDVIAGHFYPGDADLRPDQYVAELAALVRRLGVDVIEQVGVTGFQESAGQIRGVTTSAGPVGAGAVVLATGVLAPHLARTLGIRLPIQPGKGYSITFSAPSRPPTLPLVLKERAVCVTPWANGYRLGSTMEFSGLSESLNRVRIAALKRGAAEYLEEPVGPVEVEQWYGFRPMTYDDLPIIGPAPRHRGLWIASGHGMLGMTLSAGTAAMLADQMAGRKPDIDPTPFLPSRFS